jgi:hypothetical protein
MFGFLDDGAAFPRDGTAGNPAVGFGMGTTTTGETAAGVSWNHI